MISGRLGRSVYDGRRQHNPQLHRARQADAERSKAEAELSIAPAVRSGASNGSIEDSRLASGPLPHSAQALRFEYAMTARPKRNTGAVTGVICVECLQCRHRGLIGEHVLASHGLSVNAPIASFAKRLVCKACGHQSVKAFRATRDAARAFIARGSQQ
jgi:hypothetical protein